MTDPQLHSRDALAQRFGENYRWFVLLTLMIVEAMIDAIVPIITVSSTNQR